MSSSTLNLAGIRQLAGCSLEDIAAKTKISIRFLRAIELEQFEQLPGGIFTTSYLRQYAAAIGYSETALVDHYLLKASQAPSIGPGTAPENRNRNRLDRWLKMPAQAIRQL